MNSHHDAQDRDETAMPKPAKKKPAKKPARKPTSRMVIDSAISLVAPPDAPVYVMKDDPEWYDRVKAERAARFPQPEIKWSDEMIERARKERDAISSNADEE